MSHIFTNADQEIVEYDGSPLIWRVSAYVLIVQNDQLLILKNRTEKLYDVPGGGIDIDEDIETAIHREAMEEVGAKVKLGKLVHVQEGWFQYKTGSFHHTVQLFYEAQLVELSKPTDVDTEFVGFVKLSEITKYPLPMSVHKALEKLNTSAR